VFLKTLNALFVCFQYKHPRSMKRVIRSDKPVTVLLLFWSHKCDISAEPRSRIIATSAVKGLNNSLMTVETEKLCIDSCTTTVTTASHGLRCSWLCMLLITGILYTLSVRFIAQGFLLSKNPNITPPPESSKNNYSQVGIFVFTSL
jgi:hypothetical protein